MAEDKKKKRKTAKKQTEDWQKLISEWNKKYEADIDSTNGIRWDWYKNISYTQGDQWMYFNKMTKKLVELPRRDPREIRVTINIIWYMLRAIRGFVLRFQPRHDVYPVGTEDVNLDNAKDSNALLDWNWRASGLNKAVGDAVFNACWALGPVLLSWDSEKSMVKYTAINPLNIWWDSFAGDDPESLGHIGIVFEKTEEEIRKTPEYDLLEKDDKLTPSSGGNDNREDILDLFEKRVLKENKDGATTTSEGKRFKGREVYYKKQSIVNGKTNTKIWVLTWIRGMNKPLRHREFEMDFNPIEVLYTDQLPGKFYGTGLVKHAIPPQTAINRLESQRLSYIAMAGKYRILEPKGAGIKEIHDVGGTRLKYNGTTPFSAPRELGAHGMPHDVSEQLFGMERHIQKIMGVFDQFLGQGGGAGESGKHAESMQAASANNQAEFQLNIERFIENIGYKTLCFYEKFLDEPMTFRGKDLDGRDRYIKGIGFKTKKGKSAKGASRKNAKGDGIKGMLPIMKSRVEVKVGSQLAHTEDARFNRALELGDRGWMDPVVIMENLGFSNVADMLERAKKMKDEYGTGKAAPAPGQPGQAPVPGQPGQAPVGPPPGPQGPIPEEVSDQAAIDETAQFLQGNIPPGFEGGTPGATPEHTMTMVRLMTTGDFEQLDDEMVKMYIQHVLTEAQENGTIQTQEIQELIKLVNPQQ